YQTSQNRSGMSSWQRIIKGLAYRSVLEPHANSDRLALFHTGSPAFRNPSKSFSRLAGSAIGTCRRRYDRHFSTSSPGYSAIFWRLSVMNRCMASRAASAWPRFQSDAARRARAASNVPAMRAKLLAASAKLPSKYAPSAIAQRQGSDSSGLSLRDSKE